MSLLCPGKPPATLPKGRVISSELATDTGKQEGGRISQISKKMSAHTTMRLNVRKEKATILKTNTANKKARAKFDTAKLKQIMADAQEIISEQRIVTVQRKRYRKELADLHGIKVGMLDKILRRAAAKNCCGACAEEFCVKSMAITYEWIVARCDMCSERRRVTAVENFGGVLG